MGLNLGAIGEKSAPILRSWTEKDSMLYALGIGTGVLDPTGFELEFTTENTAGVPQKVLPTFATVVGHTALKMSVLGEIDLTKMVHGEQRIKLNGELAAKGSVQVTTTVAGIYDKGSGALVVLENDAVDAVTGAPAFSTRMGLFVRGAGGFGGPRVAEDDVDGTLVAEPIPSRDPDWSVQYTTRLDQPLLYRLSGDHSPLHSDPAFAIKAGFDRPILHGLCTYGFTGRGILHLICESDPARFGTMQARFSRPSYPGDTLIISVWDVTDQSPGAYRFRTEDQRGEVIIDAGLFRQC
jgi:acyl dehydratase